MINLNKWWSVLAAIGVSALSALSPTVQGLLSAHPTATAVIGSIIAVVLHWLPSPASLPTTTQTF
jgi:hypothetical protein